MTCDDAKAAIDELADGELDPAREAAVRAHVDRCEACGAELRGILGLEALLKRAAGQVDAPRGLAEKAIQSPRRAPGRRFSLIPLTAAAGILVVLAGLQLFHQPYTLAMAYADIRSGKRDLAVDFVNRHQEAVGKDLLTSLADLQNLERQQSAALLIASLKDEEFRRRLLAEQAEPESRWQLSSIGTDVSDGELVGYAVGLVRSDRTAREGLQILARLDQGGVNREAHRAIIAQARELIAAGQEGELRTAFRILERLNILQADLVEFIDLPDLGPKALDFLKRRSGKDFGTDKAAWRAWFESRKG